MSSSSSSSSSSSTPLSRFCESPLSVLLDRISSRLRLCLSSTSSSLPLPTPTTSLDHSNSSHSQHPLHSRFQAQRLPTITIQAYLTRLVTFAPISTDALLLALLYLHRAVNLPLIPPSPFLESNHSPLPSLPYHLLTVHRLLLASLVIANKFISDRYLSASRAAKVGGVSIEELAAIERGLLESLDFRLYFTPPQLDHIALWVLDDPPSPSPSLSLPSTQPHSINQPASTSLSSTSLLSEPPTASLSDSSPTLDSPLPQPATQTQSAPIKLETPEPRSRPWRVFLPTHFVCDPNLNSNYLSRRPVSKSGELEGATSIIITTLDKKVLKVRTDLIGYDAHTGEKVSRTVSTRSYHHSLPLRNISPG